MDHSQGLPKFCEKTICVCNLPLWLLLIVSSSFCTVYHFVLSWFILAWLRVRPFEYSWPQVANHKLNITHTLTIYLTCFKLQNVCDFPSIGVDRSDVRIRNWCMNIDSIVNVCWDFYLSFSLLIMCWGKWRRKSVHISVMFVFIFLFLTLSTIAASLTTWSLRKLLCVLSLTIHSSPLAWLWVSSSNKSASPLLCKRSGWLNLYAKILCLQFVVNDLTKCTFYEPWRKVGSGIWQTLVIGKIWKKAHNFMN